MFQSSPSWPLKYISRGINVRELGKKIFLRVKLSRKWAKIVKLSHRESLPHKAKTVGRLAFSKKM